MVDVRPIRGEADHDAALQKIEMLIDARPGTADGDHLEVLITLVQAYEATHHAVEAPDPIALLEFVLEQRGLDRTALQPMLGGRGRVSEIMTRKRALTLPMIRRLQRELRLPADALVQPYPLDKAEAA